MPSFLGCVLSLLLVFPVTAIEPAAALGSCLEEGGCTTHTQGSMFIQRKQTVMKLMQSDVEDEADEDEDEDKEDNDAEEELVRAVDAGVVLGMPPKKSWRDDGVQAWRDDGVQAPPQLETLPLSNLLQTMAERVGDARPADKTDIEGFLAMHNLYRCMHGVPDVTWSNAMAASAYDYIKGMTSMKHSQSYNIAPPAGPAGENLAMSGGYQLTAADATDMWYSEVNDCKDGPTKFTDGCANGVGGKATGHFTAMIWKGVKEIGCAFSDSTNPALVICRYRAGDSLSMDTPNMNKPSNYPSQVFPQTKSEEECEGGSDGSKPKPEPTAGGGNQGNNGNKAAGKCKKKCAKKTKAWAKKCKTKGCSACPDCASNGEGDPVAKPTTAPATTAAPPAPGKCLVSDPNWTCKGYQCVGHAEYTWYHAAGGPWCLTADSSYCQKEDSSWCSGSCSCPGSCPHACGRCPPK